MVSNCDLFYDVQKGDSCPNIAQNYSITLDEFYAWNPAVDDCADLEYGYYVCVGVLASSSTATITSTSTGTGITTPTPYQSGMATNCDKFYDVESGDGCYDIAASNDIALTNFYNWNPAVSSCSNLWPSYYVCVGTEAITSKTSTSTPAKTTTTGGGVITPTPTQSGMVANCDKFYDVESGDGCYDIAASYGIALTDFYSWNLGVSSCTDLWPSYYVCVGTGTAGVARRTIAAAQAITTAA